MTAESNKLLNDPNFVIQFAVGEPIPSLVQQDRNAGITIAKVFYNEPKRYVWKKAHSTSNCFVCMHLLHIHLIFRPVLTSLASNIVTYAFCYRYFGLILSERR
jgi:hypothetical protein